MGKKEGLSNTVKRKVHDVYVKDKTDVKLLGSRPWMCFPYVLFVGADHLYNLFPFVEHFWAYPKPSWRPSWFIHENVKAFPLDYLENKFKLHYSCQSTNISPQRFGKPMNRSIVAKEHKCAICCKSYRCVCLLGYFFNFLVCVCVFESCLPGCAPTEYSMTKQSTCGMGPTCVRCWSSWLHTKSFTWLLMTCTSWPSPSLQLGCNKSYFEFVCLRGLLFWWWSESYSQETGSWSWTLRAVSFASLRVSI